KRGVETRRRTDAALPRLLSTPPFHVFFSRLFSTSSFLHAVLDYVTSERARMRSVVTAVLLCAGVAPAAAQSNAERVANDVYTRSHHYDLVHQRIEVRTFDCDSTSFH